MNYMSVKNWTRHQAEIQPGKRKSFIALHTALLDDIEFLALPQSAQLLLIKLWLLRGRLGHNIPHDSGYLARVLGNDYEPDLWGLLKNKWLSVTDRKKEPERKPAKNYKKDYPEDFDLWWKVYPRKSAKPDAMKAWEQTAEVRPPTDELIGLTKAYAKKMNGNVKYTKLPGGWLRDRRWEDDGLAAKKETPMAKINRVLDSEQIDHYDHPLWKKYVSAVVAGEVKPGFEVYVASQ